MLFLLCFLAVCFEGVVEVEDEGELAAGASDAGDGAAIAAVARPADSNAVAINLIMGSPAVVFSSMAKNTPDRLG